MKRPTLYLGRQNRGKCKYFSCSEYKDVITDYGELLIGISDQWFEHLDKEKFLEKYMLPKLTGKESKLL